MVKHCQLTLQKNSQKNYNSKSRQPLERGQKTVRFVQGKRSEIVVLRNSHNWNLFSIISNSKEADN
jgi:hypothetical protein